MNTTHIIMCALSAASAGASAQVTEPWIHDPSTLAVCDGKYYTFGTGGGGLISDNGYYWHEGAERPGGGAAPDCIKLGDRYLMAYSVTGGGLGRGHAGQVVTMWNETLDPQAPNFKWTEPVEVANSLFDEDCDAIDAGLILCPDSTLWVTYGTYFGYIRIVQLDPRTGARLAGAEPRNIAIDCEATKPDYRDGWYYLYGTHGTCCDGPNSTYHIVVGRSRSVTGPYLDNVGRDMMQGGGKMVIGASERLLGAGHFGRFVEDEGIEKLSIHYEADLDRSGRSVLAIRPLLWKNGWPVGADNVKPGTYRIVSERRGYCLELAVDFVRLPHAMQRFWEKPTEPVKPLAAQQLADVEAAWNPKSTPVRYCDYMGRPHQQWDLAPLPGTDGSLAGPYFTLSIHGTNRTLTVTNDFQLEALSLTQPGDPTDAQLWRIDQATDGSFRLMPKKQPRNGPKLALAAVADSTPALAPYNPQSDNSKFDLVRVE